MPQSSSRAPSEIIDQARELMKRAEWKKTIEVLQEIFSSRATDKTGKAYMAKAHMLRGQCLVHMAQLDKAQEDCNRALSLARESKEPQVEAEALRILGNISWKLGDFKKGFEHLNKAKAIAKEIGDLRLEGTVHLELGSIYSMTGDNVMAEREYRESVLALEKAGDMHELARAYNNFANNFTYQKKWDKAVEMYSKCKKIAEKINDEGAFAWGAFNKAECLVELGRPKEAMQELEVAIPLLEKTDDNYGMTSAIQVQGMAQAKLGNWKEAEELLIKARRMAQKNKIPMIEAIIVRDIGRMYKMRADKDKAVLYLKEAQDILMKIDAKRELDRVLEELKGL